MNKKLRLLLAVLTVTTIFGAASACGGGSESSSGDSISSTSVKKERYTVRFVNADNSVITQKEYEEGSMPEAPADPTYTAEHYTYVFAGWDKEITAVEDDVIYKAVYTKTATNYTVTFMVEGVQVGEALSYNLDNPTVTEPAIPAKAGYVGKWESYTLDGGNKTVNAVYTLDEYTVTFVADGETVGTATYTIDNKEITAPAVPEKAHYTGAWESYELTSGDVTVNAVYTAIDYTATFMADGVQVGEVLSYNLDNPTVEAPAVPEKDHYTGAWEEYTLDGGNKVINAVYTAIDYTVTFMADGVQVGEALTYNLDNATVAEPAIPAKEGYGAKWEEYTLDGGNKVVNAVYKLGEYTVTFKADGETVGTATYTINNKEIVEPAVPEKAHYTGVWESYELTTGDVTVNAVYTAINYTVTFKADGVQVGEELSYNLDNPTVTEPAVPEKDHYTGAWEEYTLDGGDKVINAVYTGIEYTITYFNEAGEVFETRTYALDNLEIDEPEVPAKKGYTGVWLDYELNGGDVEVRPEYTVNTYVITYDANGGVATMETQEVVYGEEYTIEATASSSRFFQSFLGWVDADGNFVTSGVWEIDSDVILKAKYTDSVTFDEATNPPVYIRGSRIASFSIVDDPVKGGKALRAQTTSDSTGDTALFITVAALADFFADPTIEYFAFDVMTDADRTTLSDNLYNVTYHDYRTGAGKWTRYENGNHKYSCIPSDAFKTYYFPRSVYQSWVDNNLTDARFILAGPLAKVYGGDSFYIDNLRGATAEEYANSHWSFERGNVRTDNGNDVIFYSGNEGGWDLNFSNLYATTAKFTNTITSDGGRAFTFQKRAGTTVIVLNHTTDTAMEKALREGVYIAYDLYVPEGSNASAVKDNASGVYATLKQGWNTIYAKVDATDNVVSAFWDSTESTYVIDNIRFVTAEQYNTEMLSFEGKAGVLRDSTSDAKPTVYIYTPRDMLANRWTMVAQGDGCMLSNQRYDTEIVKDGKQSFAFHKANNYMSMSLNTSGEMYALLKNGFTFWVYADLDEQAMINGVDTGNFGNGANGKFNGGAGIKINAREWTQVVVTEDDINASGRFLIIQGSTAGTYYLDGFEPLPAADAE